MDTNENGEFGSSFRDKIAFDMFKLLLREGLSDSRFDIPYKEIDMQELDDDEYEDEDDDEDTIKSISDFNDVKDSSNIKLSQSTDMRTVIDAICSGQCDADLNDGNDCVRVYNFDYLAISAYDCADALLRARDRVPKKDGKQ